MVCSRATTEAGNPGVAAVSAVTGPTHAAVAPAARGEEFRRDLLQAPHVHQHDEGVSGAGEGA